MKFFKKLEQKYARYAVSDLMRHIGMLYTIGILIQIFMPGVYENYLCLNARAILHGQVWRIITFLRVRNSGRGDAVISVRRGIKI